LRNVFVARRRLKGRGKEGRESSSKPWGGGEEDAVDVALLILVSRRKGGEGKGKGEEEVDGSCCLGVKKRGEKEGGEENVPGGSV